jgi:hypothetical protein
MGINPFGLFSWRISVLTLTKPNALAMDRGMKHGSSWSSMARGSRSFTLGFCNFTG